MQQDLIPNLGEVRLNGCQRNVQTRLHCLIQYGAVINDSFIHALIALINYFILVNLRIVNVINDIFLFDRQHTMQTVCLLSCVNLNRKLKELEPVKNPKTSDRFSPTSSGNGAQSGR